MKYLILLFLPSLAAAQHLEIGPGAGVDPIVIHTKCAELKTNKKPPPAFTPETAWKHETNPCLFERWGLVLFRLEPDFCL